MTEDMTEPQPQFQNSVDVKLDYIQRDIREIKDSLKDNVTRREFTDALTVIRKEFTDALKTLSDHIASLQKKEEIPTFWQRNQDKMVWGIIFIILMLFYFLLTRNGFPKFLNS